MDIVNFDYYIDCEHSKQPILRQLAILYLNLRQKKEVVIRNLREFTDGKGIRLHRDHQNYFKHERIFEVLCLRLNDSMQQMFQAIEEIHAHVEQMNIAIAQDDEYSVPYTLPDTRVDNRTVIFDKNEKAIACNNILCALALADEATALYYRIRREQIHQTSLFGSHYAIEQAYKDLIENPPDSRVYFIVRTVWTSACDLMNALIGDSPPKPPFLTAFEAEHEINWWRSYADTVGGDAAAKTIYQWRESKAEAEAHAAKVAAAASK
jgi:hypothetical protein